MCLIQINIIKIRKILNLTEVQELSKEQLKETKGAFVGISCCPSGRGCFIGVSGDESFCVRGYCNRWRQCVIV